MKAVIVIALAASAAYGFMNAIKEGEARAALVDACIDAKLGNLSYNDVDPRITKAYRTNCNRDISR